MLWACAPEPNKNNGEQKNMGLNIEYSSYWVVIKGQEDGGTCFDRKKCQKKAESAV